MKVTRNSDGSYKRFPGREKTTYHAMMIKFGKEFSKQHGHAAKVGDIVRHKNGDGSYNKGSIWQIKTKHGWRRSVTKYRKPTAAEIRKQMKNSRKGR